MKLTALIDALDEIDLASGQVDGVEVSAVEVDSRQIEPGALFVALAGASFDGHDFVEAAVADGAAAVLVDRARPRPLVSAPVLVADDTRRALGALAAAFYDHPSRDLCVVGVTGTNGKTTTTWMLESLFSACGRPSGLVGTIEHRWGDQRLAARNATPESLVIQRLFARMRDDQVARVAMEVSSHGLATHRLRATRFDAAIFTNLSSDHLDFHGDADAYRRTKERLFTELLPQAGQCGKSPAAILNVDDAVGRGLQDKLADVDVETVSYAVASEADYRARQIEQSLSGSSFVVVGASERFEIDCPLIGEFNVSNALAAAVAARQVGLTVEQIQAGFGALEHIPGRMQRVQSAGGPTVFVDYAHNADAIARALSTLRPLTRGRLIAVFGCGGDRDRHKRPQMGRAALERADLVVITSDNPRTEDPEAIIDQIVEGMDGPRLKKAALRGAGTGYAVVVDRGRAIELAAAAAGADDVILIAGKGHEAYQEIGGERLPFDDARAAQRALDDNSTMET
jgi:UDP-N-acetylmuramyl-tripeptide synthetase